MIQIGIAEHKANGTLGHHGTMDEIGEMIRNGLERDPLLGIGIPGIFPIVPLLLSPPLEPQAMKDRLKAASRKSGSVKELIARLAIPRSTYFAARNGNVSEDLKGEIEEKLARLESEINPDKSWT